jgi:hypothetical protein
VFKNEGHIKDTWLYLANVDRRPFHANGQNSASPKSVRYRLCDFSSLIIAEAGAFNVQASMISVAAMRT